jgi:Zn-dependent M28 family amino/carboxypeptidase
VVRYRRIASIALALPLVSAIAIVTSSCAAPSADSRLLGPGLSDTTLTASRIPAAPSVTSAVLTSRHPRKVDHSADERFDATRAMADIRTLTAFGVRKAGTPQEAQGAAWVARRLRELGYQPQSESFALPNGATSQNVFVVVPGTEGGRLIFGAHIDSKSPSPGANDDASGVGILLEIARLLKLKAPGPTVEIVFFGAEEISDGNPDHHHAGSRYRASMLGADERAATRGMLSVDMASFGTKAYVRTMGVGPMSFARRTIAEGARLGLPISYLKDPGSSGWSDHEPYEKLGIPSGWLEWLQDPAYHTPRDTAGRLSMKVVQQSGDLVLALIRR